MKQIGMIVAILALTAAAWAESPLFSFCVGENSLWITDAATGKKVFRFGNLSFQWEP